MKEFSSFDAFSNHMKKVSSQYNKKEFLALNFLGKILEEEAKHKIGHLQKGAGPFESWQDLAESTKLDKQRKGYVFNDEYNPLYRTGELRESIHHVVNTVEHKLIIGSDSDIGLYQEIGTQHIPSRSFLGLTMFKEKAEIQYVLSSFLVNWISDSKAPLRRSINGSL
jgi:hypothetical protein